MSFNRDNNPQNPSSTEKSSLNQEIKLLFDAVENEKKKNFFLMQCSEAPSIAKLHNIAKEFDTWFQGEEQNLFKDNISKETRDELLKKFLELDEEFKKGLINRINEVIQERNQFVAKRYQEWESVDRKFKDLSALENINQTFANTDFSAEPSDSFKAALEQLEKATLSFYRYSNSQEPTILENENNDEAAQLQNIIHLLSIKNASFRTFSLIKSLPATNTASYKDKITAIRKSFVAKVDVELERINDDEVACIKRATNLLNENPTSKNDIIKTIQQLAESKKELSDTASKSESNKIEPYKTMFSLYQRKCFSSNIQDKILADFSIFEIFDFQENMAQIDNKMLELKNKLTSKLTTYNQEYSDSLNIWINELNTIWVKYAENPITGELVDKLKIFSDNIAKLTLYVPKFTANLFNTPEEIKFDNLCVSLHSLHDSIKGAVEDLSLIRKKYSDLFRKEREIKTDLDNFTEKVIHINGFINLKERIKQYQVSAKDIQSDLQKVAVELETKNNIKLPITGDAIGKIIKSNHDTNLLTLEKLLSQKKAMVVQNYNQGIRVIKQQWYDDSSEFDKNFRRIKRRCDMNLDVLSVFNPATLLLDAMDSFSYLLKNNELLNYKSKISDAVNDYSAIQKHIPESQSSLNEPIKSILGEIKSIDEYLSSVRADAKDTIVAFFTANILDKWVSRLDELEQLPKELSVEAASAMLNTLTAWEKVYAADSKLTTKMNEVSSLLDDVNDPFTQLNIRTTELFSRLPNTFNEKKIQAETILANAADAMNEELGTLSAKLNESMSEQAELSKKQLESLDLATLQLADDLEKLILSNVKLDNKTMNSLRDRALQNKMDVDNLGSAQTIAMNTTDQEKTIFTQKNKFLIDIINNNPQFALKRKMMQEIERDFEAKKGQISRTIHSFSSEVNTKNNILISSIDTFQNTEITYTKIKKAAADTVARVKNIKIGDEIDHLERQLIELINRNNELSNAITNVKNTAKIENLINAKFENNRALAEIIERLKVSLQSIINNPGYMNSLQQEKSNVEKLSQDLINLKTKTNATFDNILPPIKEEEPYFVAKIKGMVNHFNSTLALDFSTNINNKINAHQKRLEVYQDLDRMSVALQNDDIILSMLLKEEIIRKEIMQLENQIQKGHKNLNDLLPDKSAFLSGGTAPCKKLEKINENLKECAELENKKQALLNKVLRHHETILELIKDSSTDLSKEAQKALNDAAKRLEPLAEYLHNEVSQSQKVLTKGLNAAKRALDDAYRDAEIRGFADKDLSRINYKVFIHFQNHILTCLPMQMLLKHNRKQGSLKTDLVNRYQARIKRASNLKELLLAIESNPKDKNAKDAKGNDLSLRGNKSSTFFTNSTSNDLMEELSNEFYDQLKSYSADAHVYVKRNSM